MKENLQRKKGNQSKSAQPSSNTTQITSPPATPVTSPVTKDPALETHKKRKGSENTQTSVTNGEPQKKKKKIKLR